MSKPRTSLKLRTSLLMTAILILLAVVTALLLVFGYNTPVSVTAEETVVTHNHTTDHTGNKTWKQLAEGTGTDTTTRYYLGAHVSGTTATLSKGNYYLYTGNGNTDTPEEAIKLSKIGVSTIVITGNVTLCLNGYYITGTANAKNTADGSVIEVSAGATFTLCDCQHDNAPGRIRQGNAEKGGGVHVLGTGKFIMQGGVIRACTAVRGGGVHVESGAEFTMSGGRIRKNNANNGKVGSTTANGNGAGVYVATGGKFTMTDGEIFQNVSELAGGGVYIANNLGEGSTSGTFTMSGGIISNNIAHNGGGGVSLNKATFTMTGGTIGGTEEGQAIYDEKTGKYKVNDSIETEKALLGGNTALIRGGGILNAGGTVEISGDAKINYNCVLNADAIGGGGGILVTTTAESPIKDGVLKVTGGEIASNQAWRGGGVFVGGNSSFAMSGGTIGGEQSEKKNTANAVEGVDDKGEVVYSGGLGGGVYVNGGTFTMSGNANVIGNNAKTGGGVYVNDGCTFTMENGTISYNTVTAIDTGKQDDKGAKIYYGGNGGGVLLGASAKLIMNAGAIDHNTSARHGGGVYVYSKATLTMNNGTMSGNVSQNGSGGAVCVASAGDIPGEVIIWNGTISDNRANDGGGLASLGNITVHDGTISGNTATSGGGGVLIQDATLTLEKGSISGNMASNGGGVYAWKKKGKFLMSGGTVKGNTASSNGGGVYVTTAAEFTMSGGVIGGNTDNDANTASSGGGVCITKSTDDDGTLLIGKFNMTAGTIIGNKANNNGNGGGVMVNGGEFTMSNGEIKNNAADSFGGGVIVGGDGKFELTNGEISGNTATNGGGVYATGATFEMKGGTICNNSATERGGGVYVLLSATFKMSGGTISGNTATVFGGGVYVAGNGAFTVSGAVIINENTVGQSANNVYLPTGKKITVAGELNKNPAEKKIGVTLATGYTGAFTSGYSNNNSATAPSEYFSSDTGKCIWLQESEAWLGHKIDDIQAAKDKTCTEVGYHAYWHCSVCGKYYSDEACTTAFVDKAETVIEAGHTPQRQEIKLPTCTENGYKQAFDFCKDCGEHFYENTLVVIPDDEFKNGYLVPAAHSYEETDSKDPTCTAAGYKNYACSVCGITKNEPIDALGHSARKKDKKDPTCTESGNIEYWHCSVCGENFINEECTTSPETTTVGATGHSYGTKDDEIVWEWTKDYSSATATFTCTNTWCTDKTKTIPATIADTHQDASCQEKGYDIHEATVTLDGAQYTNTTDKIYIDTLPHIWTGAVWTWAQVGSEWTVTKVTLSCSGYGTSHTVVVTKDITVTPKITDSDCTTAGEKRWTASLEYDGHLFTTATDNDKVFVIPAKGHSFTLEEVTTPATCTEDGVKYKKCSRCSALDDTPMKISALGHDWTENGSVVVTYDPSKTYTAFGTFDLSDLAVTFTCGRDSKHNETLANATEGPTVTYQNGNCLHYGDEMVTVTATLPNYGEFTRDLEVSVVRRAVIKVDWQYSSDNNNWTDFVFTNGVASIPYDGKTYSVRVKFVKNDNDDILAGNISEYVYKFPNTFTNVSEDGYSYSITEEIITAKFNNYSIAAADLSRTVNVTKATITVGGAGWLSDGSPLMSGSVKLENGKYKFYPAGSGEKDVEEAVVRHTGETITVTYGHSDILNRYEVSYVNDSDYKNAAIESGYYTAKAIFTLTAAAAVNYKLAAATGATLDEDNGTVSVTKEWYIAIVDNGFKNKIANWTFGSESVPDLPDLEKPANIIALMLYRETAEGSDEFEPVGVQFNLGNYSDYINRTTPVGKYRLWVSVDKVMENDVEYAGAFTHTFEFRVTPASFTVTNAAGWDKIALDYDGEVHLHTAFTPTAPLITVGEGVWADYTTLYGDASITFSHSDLLDVYYAASDFAGLDGKPFINAGNYEAMYKISAPNYDDIKSTFEVEIAKQEYSLANVAFDSKTVEKYDGNSYSLDAIKGLPTATGVTVNVEYGNNSPKKNANENGYDVTATLTLSETDRVNYKFVNSVGDIQNDYTAVYTAKLIIKRATYDLANVVFDSKTIEEYDGNYHALDGIKGLPTDTGVNVNVEYDDISSKKNADEYPVTATLTLSEADRVNYKFINSAGDTAGNIENDYTAIYTAKLIIKMVVISLDLTFDGGEPIAFDGNSHSVVLLGTIPAQVQVVYTINGELGNTAISTGVYNLTATLSINDDDSVNYKFADGTQLSYSTTLTITAAAIPNMDKVSFDSKSVKYTGNAYSLSISGKLPAGVTYSYENNSHVDVGDYEVIVHFYHNKSDYAPIEDMKATLSITKATYNMSGVSFTDATVVYTGNAHSLSLRGTLPAGVTYTYVSNSRTNVGSQKVTVQFTGDSKNYELIGDMHATLTVIPASLAVAGLSLEGQILDYDGNTHSLSVNGKLPDGVSVKYYIIVDGEEVEFDGAAEAGSYDVIAKFELSDSVNYKAIRPLNARLTIRAAEKPTPPPTVIEPSVDEVEIPIMDNQDHDLQANVVMGKIVHEDDFPYWIIAVCVIAAEVIAMAAMGGYMAFRSYKKKKR